MRLGRRGHSDSPRSVGQRGFGCLAGSVCLNRRGLVEALVLERMEQCQDRDRDPPELRERAVRVVLEHQDEDGSQWEAMCPVVQKLGPTAETVRSRCAGASVRARRMSSGAAKVPC